MELEKSWGIRMIWRHMLHKTSLMENWLAQLPCRHVKTKPVIAIEQDIKVVGWCPISNGMPMTGAHQLAFQNERIVIKLSGVTEHNALHLCNQAIEPPWQVCFLPCQSFGF